MALCSFSSHLAMQSSTAVDNAFINEFLPSAPENAVKVYLYGLFMCTTPHADDNSLDGMSTVLSLSEDEIFSAYSYWQEVGLVQIVNSNPFEVKYLSPKENYGRSKLREKSKYQDFNNQIQTILSGRMIKPIEFNEYYNLIENHHFEPEALVMIIKYCTTLKSTAINYPYILAVAKSFEQEGIKSAAAVEDKLLQQEQSSAQVKDVLKALGLSRDGDLDERNMYLKWTNTFGFTHNVILQVAKSQNKKGGFSKLDELLTKYFEQKLFTLQEIEEYSKEREMMFAVAKKVTSTLGLYYQNLDSTVDVYIKEWINKGYDEAAISLLAFYCYKQDVRSLSLMDEVVNKFFKLGLVSVDAINRYTEGVVENDNNIKKILDKLDVVRRVNSSDRELYKTWTELWQMPEDVILLVCEKSKSTAAPLRFMNKILSDLNQKNFKTLKDAEKELSNLKVDAAKPAQNSNFTQREYTKDQLNALFDSLDDIEV